MRAPSFLARFAAVAVLGLSFAGCDTADLPSVSAADAVTLDAQAETSGDVLYDLAPLRLGERFDVAVDAGDDQLRLRSTRTPSGYALAFVPGDVRPDSVVVTYLNRGVAVADAETYAGDEDVPVGTAQQGPDSWHYVWRNGAWTIAKDWNQQDLTNGASTPFVTRSGKAIEVSDVVFTVYGLDAPPPKAVRFETPRDIEVTAQAFGRPLREADVIRR
ncbi:hypothetical protein [Rubrivirga sp.]|uniref:hypothetical protein n=1 Tax=Rubrivirga sp. TaxID=1885344 RepID=UPI003B518185